MGGATPVGYALPVPLLAIWAKLAQVMRVLLAKWKTTLRLPKKETSLERVAVNLSWYVFL